MTEYFRILSYPATHVNEFKATSAQPLYLKTKPVKHNVIYKILNQQFQCESECWQKVRENWKAAEYHF